MIFHETTLKGAYVIELQPSPDPRGSFVRTFCTREFEAHGLKTPMVQASISISKPKHTIRGMHYQVEGFEEAKLVHCIRGRILDTIIDIRRDSPTYCRHVSTELTADNDRMLYVPEGFAHGFITLEDNCHVMYQMSDFYVPEKGAGIRWNDPLFGIEWPTAEPFLSEKDAALPDFVR